MSDEKPLLQILNRIADLIFLNVLVFVLSLPLVCLILLFFTFLPINVFTVGFSLLAFFCGSSFIAMHHCLIKMVRNEESYLFKTFFKAYKENFIKGNILWSIFLIIFLFLFYDNYLLNVVLSDYYPALMKTVKIIVGSAIVFVYFVFIYALPLYARYENSIKQTLKNALVLVIYAFPRSLLMFIIHFIRWAMIYLVPIESIPFIALFFIAFPAYLCTLIYNPVFEKLEEEFTHNNFQ